jgi:hypothetical protein
VEEDIKFQETICQDLEVIILILVDQLFMEVSLLSAHRELQRQADWVLHAKADSCETEVPDLDC